MDITKWGRKEEWRRDGKNFRVTVSRHEIDWARDGEGPHRWCVYAYIYPKHPTFATFDLSPDAVKSYWGQPTPAMHGGCTFFKVHRKDDGEACSVQYGADYSHAWDERYYHIATPEDAYSVFNDAEELYEMLLSHETSEATP